MRGQCGERSWPALTPMAHRIAVAACEEVPDLDDDWPLLRAALAARGVVATPQIWTDPSVDWASYELVVVRGTWDYYYDGGRLQRFREWARRVESRTRLANPASVIEWNTDKRYLIDLENAGVAVVATSWVPPGQPWQVPADEFVVKPAVSAGGFETARYGPREGEAAERHVRRLHEAGSMVMVQPYVSSVDDEGETAMVYLGGRFSHAINKASLLRAGAGVDDRLWARERITATQPSERPTAGRGGSPGGFGGADGDDQLRPRRPVVHSRLRARGQRNRTGRTGAIPALLPRYGSRPLCRRTGRASLNYARTIRASYCSRRYTADRKHMNSTLPTSGWEVFENNNSASSTGASNRSASADARSALPRTIHWGLPWGCLPAVSRGGHWNRVSLWNRGESVGVLRF